MHSNIHGSFCTKCVQEVSISNFNNLQVTQRRASTILFWSHNTKQNAAHLQKRNQSWFTKDKFPHKKEINLDSQKINSHYFPKHTASLVHPIIPANTCTSYSLTFKDHYEVVDVLFVLSQCLWETPAASLFFTHKKIWTTYDYRLRLDCSALQIFSSECRELLTVEWRYM